MERATVIGAAITAVASLVVALVSAVMTRRNGERLAMLNSELEKDRARDSARQDYEYEAKKRLYAEIEPLLFEFFELADDATRRVLSLARSCREDHLKPDGSGWLAKDGYYFVSTAYQLLIPMAAIRILRRRITRVDLRLDPSLNIQYHLLLVLYRSFTEDHALARESPSLEYDPDRADEGDSEWASLLDDKPGVYSRQGIYRGTLDQVADALIVTDGDQRRLMSFGEFVLGLETSDSRLSKVGPVARELWLRFHPSRSPVLWRLLMSQFLIYSALQSARESTRLESTERLIREDVGELVSRLDFRSPSCQPVDEAIIGEIRAVRSYVAKAVGLMMQEVKASQTID